MNKTRYIAAALGVSAGVFLACLVYSLVVPYRAVSSSTLEPLFQDARRLDSLPVAGGGEFREDLFRQKKLFDCAGPVRETRTGQETRGSWETRFSLRGVSFGGRKLAVIRDETDHREYYVTEGESAAGFRVQSIEKDRVILHFGDKTMELTK